ncbi:MAG: YCF48-related protein, partial [Candidatus Poribacteria bacterium]|nr:YCF48-related protein [Candidatus Poribacteria bacterium]
WIDQTVPTQANLNAILFLNANEGWAAGEAGTILHTTDGGVTWLMQESPTKSELWDLVQTPGGQIWAIGDATTIIRY